MNKHFVISIIGLILFFAFIGMANAEIVVQTLGTIKSGDQVRLVQVCTNSTYSNITSVLYPNSTNVTGEISMNKIGNEYNYIFTKTQPLGRYIVNTHCNENGVDTLAPYDFKVTATGSEYGLYILIILLLAGVVALSLGLYERNAYWGFAAGSLLLISGIFLIINGIDIERNDWTRMAGFTVLGFALMIIFAAMYEMFQVNGGISQEED